MLCCLGFTTGAEGAEHLFPDNPRYVFESIGENVGLASRTVTAILQDSTGFVWVGTENGLFRCAGEAVQRFGEEEDLPNPWVHQIIEGEVVWIAAGDSVARYNGIRFETLAPEIINFANRTRSMRQRIAPGAGGTLWAAGATGVIKLIPTTDGYSATSFAHGELRGEVEAVHVGTDGTVWFAAGMTIGALDPETDTIEVTDIDTAVRGDAVIAIQSDSEGVIWVRTQQFLLRRDPGSPSFVRDDEGVAEALPQGLPSIDWSGAILVPSSVGLYYRDAGRWQRVAAHNGLRVNGVTFAAEDNEGALLIGLQGAGMQRWTGRQRWAAWTSQEGLPADGVWDSIRDPQGRLWIGTNDGVGIWIPAERRWRILRRADGLAGHRVYKFAIGPEG